MNCKFCNNFIPDDAKICSICGKNVEEEALVKAEPETVAVTETAETVEEKKAEKVYKKKSLKIPVILIIIAVAAFLLLYSPIGKGATIYDNIKGALADMKDDDTTYVTPSDEESNTAEDSDEPTIDTAKTTEKTVNNDRNSDIAEDIMTAVGVNGIPALVGVAGAALLGKRVSNNRKFKKQEKTSAK